MEAAKKAKNMNQVFLSGCADIILQFVLLETLVLACISDVYQRSKRHVQKGQPTKAAAEVSQICLVRLLEFWNSEFVDAEGPSAICTLDGSPLIAKKARKTVVRI